MKWKEEELQKLIEIYSDMKNSDIAKILNKKQEQIGRKACTLKLKKSKEQISKNIGNRNKIVGRDLSYENLKEIALKYKTRGEFQRLDPSAYTISRIAGYLNDICSHMVVGTYSIPQLILLCIIKKLFSNDNVEYNYKNAIKPYELDVYIKKYKLGFEYDGKGWHTNNELDVIKTDLCKRKDITLIRLIENNRKYELDIKQQLINNLEIINYRCKMNINEQDIINILSEHVNNFVNDKIIDEKEIINIISKYTNYHDFKINEVSLYNKLIKRKLIEKYTSELKRDIQKWNEEKIIKEINKYNSLGNFIKNSFDCYIYCKRHNLSYLLDKLERKYQIYTELDIIEESKKYTSLKDFREKSANYYTYVKRHNLYHLIKNLKKSKGKKPHFIISEIIEEIKKYEYLDDFRKKSIKHYRFVNKHNLYYLLVNLKRNRLIFSKDDIKNELNKYKTLREFRENSLKYYRFIIRHKLHYLLTELK